MDKTNFIVFHPCNKPINHTITLKFRKNAIMEKNIQVLMIDSTFAQLIFSWFKLTMQIHSHNTRSQCIEIGKSISTNNLFIPSTRTSHYGFIIRLTCQFHLKWVARLLCLFRVSFSTPFCLQDLPLIASSV